MNKHLISKAIVEANYEILEMLDVGLVNNPAISKREKRAIYHLWEQTILTAIKESFKSTKMQDSMYIGLCFPRGKIIPECRMLVVPASEQFKDESASKKKIFEWVFNNRIEAGLFVSSVSPIFHEQLKLEGNLYYYCETAYSSVCGVFNGDTDIMKEYTDRLKLIGN